MSLVNDENVVDMDLDLSATRKKRLRINGDNTKIVELNTSDVNILSRLSDAYPKLDKLDEKAKEISLEADKFNPDDEIDIEEMKSFSSKLKEIDNDMRAIVDEVFDSNVSEVCAPDGSMFDPFNGMPRYSHIITALLNAYEQNISEEAKKLNKNVQKHTRKYTKKKSVK